MEDLVLENSRNGQRGTRDILKDEHPQGKDPNVCSLLNGEHEPANPIIFDGLDAGAIDALSGPRSPWLGIGLYVI